MSLCVSASQGTGPGDNDIRRKGVIATSAASSFAPRRPSRSKARRMRRKENEEFAPLVGSIVEAASAFEENEKQIPVQQKGKADSLMQSLSEDIRHEKWPRALQTAHLIVAMKMEIDVAMLSHLFQGLCAQGLFRKAIQLYDRLGEQRYALSYRAFHYLIQSAMKVGAYNLGIKLYRDAKESGYSLNSVTYCMILNGLLRDKRRASRSHSVAYEIWNEIKDTKCKIDAALFRAGCGVCVALGKIEEAEALMPIMRQKGFRPDGRFYNILIKVGRLYQQYHVAAIRSSSQGYCRLRNMKGALKCFDEMKEAGILPVRVTYNTLIQGFVLNDNVEDGERMLKYTISQGCRPDVWSYTSLMKGYTKRRQIDEALRLLKEFQSLGGRPSEVTFGVLMDAYVKEGRVDLAQQQFDTLIETGLQPNSVLYNTLLKGYASEKEGSKDQIIRLLGEMKAHRIDPGVDTLNTLLVRMMREENSYAAVQALFDEMVRIGFSPDAVSYTCLLKAAHQAGNIKKCCQIFEKMQASPTIEVDVVAQNVMVSVFAEAGRMEEAEKMLQGAVQRAQERKQSVPVEAFGAIIQGYTSRGDLSSAIAKFRWFCNMGGHPDAPMLDTLLRSCVAKRDMPHALKILRATELLDKKIDLNKYREMVRRLEQEDRMQKSKADEQTNLGLERVKFWLGMPNSYYSSDWP